MGINVLSLFDGMSCGQLALSRAGIKVDNYYASEINKYAIKVTQKNFPNTIQLGCVKGVSSDGLEKIDLLIGGSPCQGFSFAGKRLNFADKRSKLFFEYVRILKEVKPTYFLLENNRMKQEYQDVISGYLGVQPVQIDSSLFTAQRRKRLYWTNIPFDAPKDKGIYLKDIVGAYDGIWVYPRGKNKGGLHSYGGKAPTVTASSWQHNFFLMQDGKKRMFTVEEVQRLQSVPVGYSSEVSNKQQYIMLGNGWTVDVITHILKGLNNGKASL